LPDVCMCVCVRALQGIQNELSTREHVLRVVLYPAVGRRLSLPDVCVSVLTGHSERAVDS